MADEVEENYWVQVVSLDNRGYIVKYQDVQTYELYRLGYIVSDELAHDDVTKVEIKKYV